MVKASNVKTIEWADGKVRLIDQTLLPAELKVLECTDYREIAEAIKVLRVRGAPAIGAAAGFGLALCAVHSRAETPTALLAELEQARAVLAATRPTAVNLFWALDRLMACARQHGEDSVEELKEALVAEAQAIAAADVAANRRMGQYGAALIPDGARILTHCNAGALATAGYGTALGVIRAAVEAGKRVHVYADETRPLLQGARLTAWELQQEHIPVTVITDNMAAHLMQQGRVDVVIVGADRIAANGDVANKIGTYGLAVLAHHHGLPFYVAAPVSTLDLSRACGEEIPIEERSPEEVVCFRGLRTAPEGVEVYNPAFDVTPHELVTAIITERGVVRPPYVEGLRAIVRGKEDKTG
ncbi:MAG TPA: S-methyl-5-thioribose-1-phosphate isomerase [Armatimonadetes bacterium]|nr:S-methyl-5-thioribose-1-phosphate isomerase [Armatimonadota bacterium]